jgi:hypothetical protein
MKKTFSLLIIATLLIGVNAQVNLNYRVSASSDDAEERASGNIWGAVGKMDITSSDLELVHDAFIPLINEYDQIIGIRFRNVEIPENSVIDNAYIQFYSEGNHDQQTLLQIHGDKRPHSLTFTNDNFDISSRPLTNSVTYWDVPAWSRDENGPNQQSPNLKDIIQEIIDLNGWQSGNAISLIISGEGKRVATSWDGDQAKAPQLFITFRDVTSVQENDIPSVSVYPNPTKDIINIKWNARINNGTITIFDLQGRLLKTENINSNSNQYQLNLSDLPNGIYILEVNSMNFKYNQKIKVTK